MKRIKTRSIPQSHNQLFLARQPFVFTSSSHPQSNNDGQQTSGTPQIPVIYQPCRVWCSFTLSPYLFGSSQATAFTNIIIDIASINSQHGGERKESEDPQHKARDLTGEERHAGSGRATFKKRRGEGSYCHTCTTQAKTQLRA